MSAGASLKQKVPDNYRTKKSFILHRIGNHYGERCVCFQPLWCKHGENATSFLILIYVNLCVRFRQYSLPSAFFRGLFLRLKFTFCEIEILTEKRMVKLVLFCARRQKKINFH